MEEATLRQVIMRIIRRGIKAKRHHHVAASSRWKGRPRSSESQKERNKEDVSKRPRIIRINRLFLPILFHIGNQVNQVVVSVDFVIMNNRFWHTVKEFRSTIYLRFLDCSEF